MDFDPHDHDSRDEERYVNTAAVSAELEAQQRRAEAQRFREEPADMNTLAREEAMDRPSPATVRAYRQVYGHHPGGWPQG